MNATANACVQPATAEDFAAFFSPPLEAHTLLVNGQPFAIGMLMRGDGGRLWVALDLKSGVNSYTLKIVRACRVVLLRQTEPVFAPCQSAAYPGAPRLLRLIGFTKTNETLKGMKVWIWQKQPFS